MVVEAPSPKSESNKRQCEGVSDGPERSKRQRALDDSPKPSENSAVTSVAVDQLWTTARLRPAQRLFVRWFIEEDEDSLCESQGLIPEESTSLNNDRTSPSIPPSTKQRMVWWEGTLSQTPLMKSSGCCDPLNDVKWECDDNGRFIWTIDYDAMEPFSAERCRVVFLDMERISHLDYTNGSVALEFRTQRPEKTEECISDADDGDETITLQDIIEAQRLMDADQGDSTCPSLESFMDTAFNSLPHTMKIELAMKYRSFADSCESFLRRLIEEKGSDHVVSVDEIKELFRDMASRS